MKKRLLALLMAACMLWGVAAGCSSGGDDQTSPTPDDQTTQTPDNVGTTDDPGSTQEVAFWDVDNYVVDESRYGGIMHIAHPTWPATLFSCEASNKSYWWYTAPAIEHLGLIDENGTVHGFLAESFEQDPENLTMTIKLREGILFHDGSELNADVLMWNLQQYKDNGINAYICNASSWEKTDEYTVVIHFDEFSNTWEEMLSQLRICSQKTFEEKGLEYVQTHAVGTGPFVFESMVDGDSITYVRNDNYWIEGLPYLDGIKITIIKDDNTRLSAMSNGEIDLIATNSSTLAEKLDQLSGINMISADSAAAKGYYYIAVDSYNEDKPTYDVRVRQAIMYGVDRNSSVPAITSGYYEAINQLALEGSYAYLEDDQLYSTYDYDPEKAKELLTEAGYPNGFDTMHHSRSGGLYEAIAVTMQSYLKEIGINMDITVMGDSATVSRLTSGNSNGEITFTSAGTSPCSFNNYTNWIQFIGKDRSRYQDIVGDFEELDVLLDKASAAAEIDDIKKSLQEVNYWLNENLILMPWCYHYFRCYSADDLHDTGWYQVHDYQSTFQLAYFD